ncbi:hypothetical protein CLV77_1545 [Brevirhabdus pacifica]|uniref:hypothetical protein n=1 Tax=Brevirhabdus pacifica TaxID=1267768 RepID=UPI000CA8063E|nr:hypothetical protein [Brevirhabdus pacifica]PJJ86983.1 hypothetical protein CLV77_1545 [Brevirhabdus pacifica]
MKLDQLSPDRVALRPADTVMRLARMGSFHQSRLSFMRVLLRRLKSENWRFERRAFEIDATGVGHAVYTMHGPSHSYSLVAFAHDLPPEQRSDRVIATAWDTTFTLFDGLPTAADIERLSRNVPLQEAGRVTPAELTVSRANRSVRLFDHVVDCLAQGVQPDPADIDAVGYLMRTTAVYGSGKLGAADRETICDRPEFAPPFQAEMLTVFLIRGFVLDLVEHLARIRGKDRAVTLEPSLRRRFGIGNSTGLGMAPFLLNHPILLNNWIEARETALARVRALASITPAEAEAFRVMLRRGHRNVDDWHSEHPLQRGKIAALKADLDRLAAHLEAGALDMPSPWDALYRWAETALSLEGQELLVALMMEPYGALVDDLPSRMSADETAGFRIDGAMTLARLRAILEGDYAWALAIDWTRPEAQARAWYVSAEKLEPRLGERHLEPVAPYEQPLAPGRDAALLHAALQAEAAETRVADFLLRHPEHRHILRRVQIAARHPYAEIRDNTVAADVLPIDLLRAKLSFFGACHFDPRSDRWVRINMFRNAPFPHEIAEMEFAGWTYPALPEVPS